MHEQAVYKLYKSVKDIVNELKTIIVRLTCGTVFHEFLSLVPTIDKGFFFLGGQAFYITCTKIFVKNGQIYGIWVMVNHQDTSLIVQSFFF